MSVIFETQKSVYSTLTGDATLMGLINGVHSYVPDGSAYPYATIGNVKASDDSTVQEKGYQVALTVNVYSQAQGELECLNIVDRIKTLLDGQTLTITGFSFIYCKLTEVALKRGGDDMLQGQMSLVVRVGS